MRRSQPEHAPQPDPGRRLLLASLIAVTFLLGCFPMSDFDVWWHLRTGQLVLERGALPQLDWFTYTNADRPWVDLYWLFQILLACLYRLGGASALVLFKASAGVAIVGLTLRSLRAGTPVWPVALAWLPGVVMLTGRLCERPELASLLLLAGFLAVLAQASHRPRLLWLLPVFEVVWVNCHGFFVLGPLTLAAYAVEQVYRRLRPTSEALVGPPAKTLVPVAAATLAACAASPYGVHAVGLSFEQFHKLGSSGIYRANVGELKTVGDFIARAGIWNPYLLGYFIVLGLGIASFVVARAGGLRPFRALLFLAAAYLGWQATRNGALFAVVAVFATAWNLEDWRARRSVVAPHRRRPGSSPGRPRNPNFVLAGAFAALGIAVLSGGLYAWAGEGRSVGLGERKDWYAHDACGFLARPGMPERMVAFNLGQSAVCIAHTAPAHKQFMDPRLEVNRQETFERYLEGMRKLWRGEPGWELPLGIDYDRPAELPALLIERGVLGRAAGNLVRDRRWRHVHADSVAFVFIPTAVAEAQGLPEVRP